MEKIARQIIARFPFLSELSPERQEILRVNLTAYLERAYEDGRVHQANIELAARNIFIDDMVKKKA
jgi:hypothetical protein